MMEFGAWITDALTAVRADCPAAQDALLAALGDLQVVLQVDDDPPACVRPVASGLEVVSEVEGARVGLQSTRAAILDLANGKRTLLQSVLADEVRLIGEIDDLAAFDAALHAFLAGAVRSPRFLPMLTQFTTETTGESNE